MAQRLMERFRDELTRIARHLIPDGQPAGTEDQPGRTPLGSAGMNRWKLAAAALLALIAASAMAGRLYAVHYYSYSQPDEDIARAVVLGVLKSGDNDTNWARTDVARQFHYTEYNFSSYYLFAANAERLLGHVASDLRFQPKAIRAHLRELSALLGGLCVLFLGVLGWRVGGPVCGLTATMLAACSVTLFQDCLYARPETFVTLLTLVLLLVLTSEKIHRGLVLLIAGFVIGVLIACKVTFLLYVPFPLLLAPALLSAPAASRSDSSEPHLFLWAASLCGYFLAIAAGFALGAPYAVRYPWEYVEGLVPLIVQYDHGSWTNSLGGDPSFPERLAYGAAYLVQTIGWPTLLLALGGLLLTVRRRDVRLLLVLAGPLLSLLYFLQTKTFFERNFSQGLPVLFLFAGLCAAALAEMAGISARRAVMTSVLIIAALATPAALFAQGIIPALDGRYQAKITAETRRVSQHNIAVFTTRGDFARPGNINARFCGPYVYMARDFTIPGQPDRLVERGYRIVGAVVSPFGDYPISTLQTYLAPSILYFAPPPATSSCELELGALTAEPAQKPVQGKVTVSSGWPLNPAPKPQTGWPWPLYDSWGGNDKNEGSLQIGPFKACGDVTVPFRVGPAQLAVSLKIIRQDGGEQVLYDGVPPTPLENGAWAEMTILTPRGECHRYTVTATDGGDGWAEWIGVGMPVVAANKK